MKWVKSSRSLSNGNCVEVANLPGGAVGVRDSKDCDGPILRFRPEEWSAFLANARTDQRRTVRFGGLPSSGGRSPRAGRLSPERRGQIQRGGVARKP